MGEQMFVFRLNRNHSEEFIWDRPEEICIHAIDIDRAVRLFINRYSCSLSEILDYSECHVIYANSVDGLEISFEIL